MTTKRTTQNLAEVEYSNVHKDRITQNFVEVEYSNVHKDRISEVLVMVEWSPYIPPTGGGYVWMRKRKTRR